MAVSTTPSRPSRHSQGGCDNRTEPPAAPPIGHKIAALPCFAGHHTSGRKISMKAMPEDESRAGYYREQGRQIRALVNLVIHPEVQAELLELAEQFERLAVQADHKVST
jgi:hypothetical protein